MIQIDEETAVNIIKRLLLLEKFQCATQNAAELAVTTNSEMLAVVLCNKLLDAYQWNDRFKRGVEVDKIVTEWRSATAAIL